jgi:hypothetical protein
MSMCKEAAMQRVIVEVRGGCVVETYSDAEEIQLTIVDWDDFETEGKPFTSKWVPCPVTAMPDETRAALASMSEK